MHSYSLAGADAVSATPSIRLLLVDDHGIVREGLRALLDDEEFVIVGEAANGPGSATRTGCGATTRSGRTASSAAAMRAPRRSLRSN